MEPLLTAAQMRDIDRLAIKGLGIPAMVLMENAGRGVARVIDKKFGPLTGKTIMVLCGKGSNGGDGFVAARHLVGRGARVIAVLVGKRGNVGGIAKVNLAIVQKLIRKDTSGNLSFAEFKSTAGLSRIKGIDIIVDALFGTGFSGEVRSPYKGVIQWMNKATVPIVAVDVPSGLDADNGDVTGEAVRARLTVTLGSEKIGLRVGKGPEHAGSVVVESIGVPNTILRAADFRTFLVDRNDIRKALPRRPFNAHKHSVGKIFVLAGSRGLTGAAAMVSQASMRAGAGAVILGTPKSVYPILARKLTEVMVEPLEETDAGSLSPDCIGSIQKFLDWADVVVIGPGLSRDTQTQELVWNVVRSSRRPLLIDADGLNALAQGAQMLGQLRNRKMILTPHSGELSRLVGLSAKEIDRDRVDIARKTAGKFGLTLALKGAPTVTAARDGNVFVNSTGNPGMATAGAGDVLSGIIATLWAQKMDAVEACYCGVYLHGLAGDIARDVYGERSLLATDILEKCPEAIRAVEEGTH